MNGWFKEQAGAFESQREAAEGGRAGRSCPRHPVPAPPHFWFHKAPALNTEPENKQNISLDNSVIMSLKDRWVESIRG